MHFLKRAMQIKGRKSIVLMKAWEPHTVIQL